VFTPYRLEEETYTSLLWVFEGITSYYDDLALVRSGVIDVTSYFELIGQTITRVLQGAGRKKQSVAESSFDAWTKFYKQDANGANAIVSYYAKGSLVALALDLHLRTQSAVSLDSVLRTCFDRYADVGLPEDGFETVCKEVSGLDLDDFFDAYVHGTQDPSLAELLEAFGVELKLSPPGQVGDKGGKPVTNPLPVTLGAVLNEQNGRTIVQSVATDGAAELAGLAPQDDLLALDGLRVTAGGLDRRLRDFSPGDVIDIAYFRNDCLFEGRLTFQEPEATVASFVLADDAPDARAAWLSSAST
jgi:predicted metalloprotease with PDZ domain